MYKVRLQVFKDAEQVKFEEWNGEFLFDTALECVKKMKGYLKETNSGREMVLCGCHDLYWSTRWGQDYLDGSGRVILVALPLSTEFYPILCQVSGAKKELTIGKWSSLDATKQGTVKFSLEDCKVFGPERKVLCDATEKKYKQLVKELPEVYRDLCRCLNFTKTYAF